MPLPFARPCKHWSKSRAVKWWQVLLHQLPLNLWRHPHKKHLQLQNLLRRPQQMLQKLQTTHPPQKLQIPKCLQSPWQKLHLSNLKLHLAQLWRCEVMTAQAKNAPKLRLRAVVAMASPAASLATSQALAVMANQAAMVDVTVVAKALRHVAHVWVMRLSAPSVMLWNLHKMPCAAWLHKPMAKC
jgi:hypothetical protein